MTVIKQHNNRKEKKPNGSYEVGNEARENRLLLRIGRLFYLYDIGTNLVHRHLLLSTIVVHLTNES